MQFDRERRALFAVVFLAFLVRAWVAFDVRDAPFWTTPIVDEVAYMQMSERMVLEQEPPNGAYYMTPGYGWFLALLVQLGLQLPGVKLVQLALGIVNAGLIFALARRWFDLRVGVLAGILWAIAPTVLLHEVLLLKPTLTVALSMGALWFVGRDEPGWRDWSIGGLLLGLAAVVRGEMVLVGLALVVVALVRGSRAQFPTRRAPLAGLLAMAVIIAVPTVQNIARGGGPVVIASSGGTNFYIGNHERADGSYVPLRPDRSDASVEEADAVQLAREQSSRALDAAGVSRFWVARGLEWWGDDPLGAIALTAKKAVLLWGAWEGTDVYSLAIAKDWVTALGNPIVRSWLIFPLALVALVWMRPWGAWPLVVFLFANWVAIVPFFVFERFRIPMSAAAMILAAAVAVHALDRWRAGDRRAVSVVSGAAVVAIAVLALPRVDRDESILHVNVGSMLLQQSRWQEALEQFELVEGSAAEAPRLEINRATALSRLGRRDEAMLALDVALEGLYAESRATGRPPVQEISYSHELAGDLEAEAGRPNVAARHYRAALRAAPGLTRVRKKLDLLGVGDD